MRKVFPFLNNDPPNENITNKDSFIYKHKVNINLYKNKENNIMPPNKESNIQSKNEPIKEEKKDDLVPFFELHPSQYMSSEEQEVVLPSSIKKEKDISDEEKEDLSDKEDNMNKKEVLNKSIGLTSELEYEYEHPSKMLTKEEFQELIRKNKESKRIQKEQEELIKNNELNKQNDKITNNVFIKSEDNKLEDNKAGENKAEDNKSEDNKAEDNKAADDNVSKLSNEKSISNKNKLSAQIILDNNTKSNVEKKKEKYGIKKYSKRKIYTSDNSVNEDNLVNHNNNSKENYQSKSNRKSKYIPKEKQMYTLNISENKSKKKIKKEDNFSYVKLFEENNNIIDTGKIISNKFYDQLQKFKLNYKYMNKNGNIILYKKYIYDIKLDNKRVIKLPKNTKKKRIINIYDILTIKIIETGNNTYIKIDNKEYNNFKNNDTFEVKKNQTYEIINHSDKFFIFELIIN